MVSAAIKAEVKDDTILLGRIRRHVQSHVANDRQADCIHPSELSHDAFCPRATFYRIRGDKPVVSESYFGMLNVFQEGHDIHHKYQKWLWDMGELIGEFRCVYCQYMAEREGVTDNERYRWWDKAPTNCPNCNLDRRFLIYDEVPAEDPEHLLAGRADLRVGERLGEIKSMSEGTLRWENPAMLARCTKNVAIDGEEKKWLDLQGAWKSIHTPFASHLRQGMLYLHCTGLKQMVYIYEFKMNQQTKEFVIRYTPSIVEPMLETCLDIKYALAKNRPPVCPHGGCAECKAYETEPDAPAHGEHFSAPSSRNSRRQSGDGEGRVQDPGTTADYIASLAPQIDGPRRRPPDGAVRLPDAVDRPHRRVVGTPGGRRTVRGLKLRPRMDDGPV